MEYSNKGDSTQCVPSLTRYSGRAQDVSDTVLGTASIIKIITEKYHKSERGLAFVELSIQPDEENKQIMT